ncbi:MAG: YbaB/EbfC family nucleoid-associated protein [bacterium]|nr:YbaB/EbfC family nucleoid-associated protein [bacterium]MDA1024514.1 YbaB/EbfC family nucleoid-associated protein [bacterium]
MFNKLKQIKDIRDQAKQMQAMMAEIVVVGQAAGGDVMITIDGNQEVQGVKITEGLSTEMIEQGVKKAMKDAQKKLQREMATKMKDMGGLDFLKGLGG